MVIMGFSVVAAEAALIHDRKIGVFRQLIIIEDMA
jgi:hypothetical protein